MMLPENEDATTGGEESTVDTGGEAVNTEDTSTDFGEGFESAFDELSEGLPQDAGSGSEAPSAGTPGQEQEAEAEPGTQPAEEEQQPSSPEQTEEAEQDQGISLDSTGSIDQVLQALMTNEGQLSQAVGEKLFKLSDADKEALETDAAAALPAMAGRVYVKSLQAATSLVRNMVPQMLQTEMNRQNAMVAVENAFFHQFPELDRLQHGKDIITVGQALQRQNPQMEPQELLRRTASAVMGMHGIQRRARRPANGGQTAFRPAPSGPGTQPNLADVMPYAGLGEDYED